MKNNGIHTEDTVDQHISFSQTSDGTQFAVYTLIETSCTFSEPIHTPPMLVLQPVDRVDHAVNSEPYCNIPNFQFGMLYIRSSLHIIFYCMLA